MTNPENHPPKKVEPSAPPITKSEPPAPAPDQATESPPPALGQVPPPPDQESNVRAVPVTAASLVAADNAKFPDPGMGGNAAGSAVPVDGAPAPGPDAPAPEHPGKPPGYKGTGRPAGSKTRARHKGRFTSSASTVPPGLDTGAVPLDDTAPQVDYNEMAGMVVDMTTNIMATLVGPEWKPGTLIAPSGATFSEKLMLQKPLAKYLESKEVPDLPPGFLLLAAIGIYSSSRFREPNTREKLGGIIRWTKGKVAGFFRRKKKGAPGVVRPEAPAGAAQPEDIHL